MPPSPAPEDEALLRDVVRAVRRICPPDLADRADDLAQVALLRILEIRRRREGESAFSPLYLKKAAYSALIDEIRRLRRRSEVALASGDGEPARAEPAAPSPDPERHAAGRELGRHIRACLARLVRPRSLAVTLHLQGHTGPQVAALLGWSAKKVENLIYRGLADLRQCLTARGVRR